MTMLKSMFSIRGAEIDQARAMLESMAKDLAASVYSQRMLKQNSQQQATPQAQNGQLAQQQQQQQQPQQPQQGQQQPLQPQQPPRQQSQQPPQGAPLNASNLEKNNKANAKAASKNQTPVAPTTAQPPFQFGASSPHGNPSYGNKIKDMNLQIPPARKKQKVAGQTPQGATPSPQLSKKSSPEARRASEPQAPPKPVFICKEADCEMSSVGFATEKLLAKHVTDEHTKPKEDPMKFVQENLALALGLEADGTPKKVPESAPAMGQSQSKQGQTPGSAGTALKRTSSGSSKTRDGKAVGKSDTPNSTDVDMTPAAIDAWASSTIDPQTLMGHLAVEPGLRTTIPDLNLYRSATPINDDTPESSKDSGASEPNSDISEGAHLDMDFTWNNGEVDLLNLDNANLTEGGHEYKEMWNMLQPPTIVPDWEDVATDFSKPFELDTRGYNMGISYN